MSTEDAGLCQWSAHNAPGNHSAPSSVTTTAPATTTSPAGSGAPPVQLALAHHPDDESRA